VIDPLQDSIENLAQLLRRSVSVDDADLRLVACSTHFGDADQPRLDALLGRTVDDRTRRYLVASGYQQWREAQRIPAQPELGTERDRVGFPLRTKYQLLGVMWVLDDGTMSEQQMRLAGETAARVQSILARREQEQAESDARQEDAVLELLAADPAARTAAAARLRERNGFDRAREVVALALSTRPPHRDVTCPPAGLEDPPEVVLRRAIRSATRGRAAVAFGVRGAQALVLLGGQQRPAGADLRELAHALHREIQRGSTELGERTTVGVGSARDELTDAAVSFRQALTAARVAATLGRPAGVWGDDPLEALLDVVVLPDWDEQSIPDVLRTLSDSQSGATLEVVETFLDLAGNVVATAERLHAHRSTIYYHLGKFQESTGLDLDDGRIRLLLHLWFRVRPTVTKQTPAGSSGR
jgi:DNA-binding PucR family transcriptional regulator